jgi:sugar phosphate isomerase/epimerase
VWRFAVQAGLVPGDSFHEKFDRLARWGYDGIEVSGSDLLRHASELRRALEVYPVQVTSACAGFQGWLVDRNPRSRTLAIAEIKEILAAGAELGIAGLISPAAYGIASRVLPPNRYAFSLEDERALLVESLLEIVESAARTGGTLLLEPLNRYADRVINTLAEGASVVEQVASPHVRLIPDTFHMNIEEVDMSAELRKHIQHIGHIHLSDSNRSLPGLGHIDFASLFATLRECGYEGALAIECMAPDDPEEALPRALTFLRAAAGDPGTV